ncbi:MAG: polysaccharide deacetylase family protein, partial [Thermoanaerobaculia bacterium]
LVVRLLRTSEISSLARELQRDLQPLLGKLRPGRRSGAGGWRRAAKEILLGALAGSGALRLCRWVHRRKALILTYHGVLPGGVPIDLYLSRNFVDLETFRWQMRFLRRRYRVVKLRDLARWLERGEPVPPRCAVVTFDDGFRNNLDLAYPVLKELGIPCTIFLTTSCIDGDRSLLWTEKLSLMVTAAKGGSVSLAVGESRIPLSTATGEDRVESSREIVRLMKEVPPRQREEILTDLERQLGTRGEIPEGQEARYQFLDWERVRAADPELVDFGAHTVNHPILSTLSEEELRLEVEESKRRIEDRGGRACDLFSYPNGSPADFGERERALLRRSGFVCAVSQIPGLNGRGADRFALRRNNVGLGHGRLLFQALISGLWTGRSAGARRRTP